MLSALLIMALQSVAIPPNCIFDNAQKPIILGVAKASAAANDVLYCEFHYQTDDKHWQVDYVKDGKKIATKTVVYSASLFAPDIEQKDYRSGELRAAKLPKFSKTLPSGWLTSYQENAKKTLKTKTINADEVAVIDAGFDHFIRAQWDNLHNQPYVSFGFLSIPHLKALTLRVSLKNLNDCPSVENAAACFSVAADSRLLRLFVGDIRLVYNANKQLIIFDGVVNIQDENAKSQQAVIRYFY